MSAKSFKKLVLTVALVSLGAYLIMGSLTNGESLANPNWYQLTVEIIVIISFFTAAFLEKKFPAPPKAQEAVPAAPAPKPAPQPQKKAR